LIALLTTEETVDTNVFTVIVFIVCFTSTLRKLDMHP
jgi:hypothetical protein